MSTFTASCINSTSTFGWKRLRTTSGTSSLMICGRLRQVFVSTSS